VFILAVVMVPSIAEKLVLSSDKIYIIQRVSQPVDPLSGRVMYKVPGQGYACALFSPNVSTESCNQAVLR